MNTAKSSAFEKYNVHEREKNILFREFIQLLVWIGFNLDSVVDKPQRSVEKIIAKISPFLENISKMAKTGMNIS
jgi:predicted DNA-binding transcriptional regulator